MRKTIDKILIEKKIKNLENLIEKIDDHNFDKIVYFTFDDGKRVSEYDWCHAGDGRIYEGKLAALKELNNDDTRKQTTHMVNE